MTLETAVAVFGGVQAVQPFFPQELVDDLRMIREVADRWSEEVRTGKAQRKGWFLAEGTILLTEMQHAYAGLEVRIRKR